MPPGDWKDSQMPVGPKSAKQLALEEAIQCGIRTIADVQIIIDSLVKEAISLFNNELLFLNETEKSNYEKNLMWRFDRAHAYRNALE